MTREQMDYIIGLLRDRGFTNLQQTLEREFEKARWCDGRMIIDIWGAADDEDEDAPDEYKDAVDKGIASLAGDMKEVIEAITKVEGRLSSLEDAAGFGDAKRCALCSRVIKTPRGKPFKLSCKPDTKGVTEYFCSLKCKTLWQRKEHQIEKVRKA